MAIRVQIFPKEDFVQERPQSLFHFPVGCPSSWDSYDQQFSRSVSENLSLKVKPSTQLCDGAKHLCLQLQPDQEPSVSQSAGESNHELSIMREPNSESLSSESGNAFDGKDQGQSHAKDNETQMKPIFSLSDPEKLFNPSQTNYNFSVVCTQNPYTDPLFTTPYGQNVHMGSQVMGSMANRVPLPFDLAGDMPIYVNPKQYHGILRRRQYRARLEAQNKLIKNRKPYLHESRHQHALKRVRGIGGRFLSTKKLQEGQGGSSSSSYLHCESDLNLFQAADRVGSSGLCSSTTGLSNGNVMLQLQEGRFLGISYQAAGSMGSNIGGVLGEKQHCSSAVR